MSKNITIKDIAREAGVSIALVSFVMNNRVDANGKQKYRVSETTKEKILAVAKRLNYQPSSAARMLRQGRTRVIGVILSDMANIFYGIIARELENWAFKRGYTLVFGSSDENPEKFSRLLRSFLEKDVEGFILVPCAGSASTMEYLMTTGRPYVVIDRHYPGHEEPSVLTDNEDAMHQAVDVLRRRGVKKMALLSYAMRISSMTDREKAFRKDLGDDALIYNIPFENLDESAEKILDQMIQDGVDGIISASNVPSVAIIKAMQKRGIRVQKDIQMVGFDYSNVYDVFDPPIPYILQPLPEIAKEASAYLFRLIDMKEKGEDISVIKDRIIMKASLKNDRS